MKGRSTKQKMKNRIREAGLRSRKKAAIRRKVACPGDLQLWEYFRNRIEEPGKDIVTQHITQCQTCLGTLSELQSFNKVAPRTARRFVKEIMFLRDRPKGSGGV